MTQGERGWGRVLRESAPYLGLGSSLAVTLLLSLWVGHRIDVALESEPLFFLVGAALGMLGAFYHIYKMYKTMTGRRR